jgi:hypothetical protein
LPYLVVLEGRGDGEGDRGVVAIGCPLGPIGDRGGTGDLDAARDKRDITGDRIDGDRDNWLGDRVLLGMGEWKGEFGLDGVLLRCGDGDAAIFRITAGDGE